MLKKLPSENCEDESIAAVSTICRSRNWDFNTQVRDRSAIDAEIEVVHGTSRTGIFLKCQLKAGRSYISSETDEVLRIRIETKYLQHWHQSNVPIVLLFYEPLSQTVYWKDIRDYLRIHATLLTGTQEKRIIEFHKKIDLLNGETLPILEQVAKGDFHYGFIELQQEAAELCLSNFFPALPLPPIWVAPTSFELKGDIYARIKHKYAFTVNDGLLYSFADVRKTQCELGFYCDKSKAVPRLVADIPRPIVMELLNLCRDFTMANKGLEGRNERYFFPLSILNQASTNLFSYTSLQGRKEERTLIYIQNISGRSERKHHAVKLSFIQEEQEVFLQVEPDWHFTFPHKISAAERKARLISEKADLHNKDYLYLLHFWRQFLSHNTDKISFSISSNPIFGNLTFASKPVDYVLPFRMTNDYFGPNTAV